MTKKGEIKGIESIVKEFFQMLGEDVLGYSFNKDEDTIYVDIRVEEPRSLIGKSGEILRSIQRILRMVVTKKLDENLYLQLDVNGYKEKKGQYLKEIANEIADKVSLSRKERALTPMSAYERRIIHMELAKRMDVETQSTGDGKRRRIVIKSR